MKSMAMNDGTPLAECFNAGNVARHAGPNEEFAVR